MAYVGVQVACLTLMAFGCSFDPSTPFVFSNDSMTGVADSGADDLVDAATVVCTQDGSEEFPFSTLWQIQGAAAGRYSFLLGEEVVPVEIDVDERGDSWLLYLNYLHKAEDNTELSELENGFPLQSGEGLGVNEAGSEFWGHASLGIVSTLAPDEFRFRGVTSGHQRVVHFRTKHVATVAYLTTGTGSTNGLREDYAGYSDHTSLLPDAINNVFNNQGEKAPTNFPFYKSGTNHWGVRGTDSRWEVDDFGRNQNNTHHQLWIRTIAECGNGVVEEAEECDEVSDTCSCCIRAQ